MRSSISPNPQSLLVNPKRRISCLTIFSTLDVELCNRLRRSQNLDGKLSNSAICRACFKLAEQIDDYEARILKTKESLVYRSVRTSF